MIKLVQTEGPPGKRSLGRPRVNWEDWKKCNKATRIGPEIQQECILDVKQ